MANKPGRRTVQPVPRVPVPIVTEHTISQTTVTTGPIPSPDIFKAYGEVLPDAPDRILRMAEDEAKGRRDREMWQARSKAIQPHLGTVAGLIIGVVTVMSGANVAISGHEWTGFGVVLLGLASLVGVFITGKVTTVLAKKDETDPQTK